MSKYRILALLFVVVALLLMNGLWGEADVDVVGLTLPAWLVGLALYMVGVGAGWAVMRSRSA